MTDSDGYLLVATGAYLAGSFATLIAVALEIAQTPNGGICTRAVSRMVYWIRRVEAHVRH